MALTAITSSASAMIGLFDPDQDILIAQFDGRPDADDIHSQAALGSMLLHPDLAGVEVYAVMGAVGTQSGTFIDSTSLFNQIFGPEGSDNWTDAWNDWNTSVTRIKNKARAVLDAGGHVWVQEAGQSNITADWIQGLLDDGLASATIKSNVTVVQHSTWNQDNTAPQDLTFVQDRATYVKIDDGNHPNSTPDWHLDDTTFMNEVFAGKALPGTEALWLLANQIIVDSGFSASYSSIDEGGVDFSDCVENWYIFGIGSNADTVRKFWDRYVIDPSGGGAIIAYIHGDVAEDGTVPSGADAPFHQMLLDDTGNRGLSIFKGMVETEGHSIEQFYDQDTTLDAAFLDQFDVIIFSLHQKIWSAAEKTALDTWLQAGGGILIYSDSAAGGLYSQVGPQNPVGQTVVNNLISQYGMEVTVDQADGVKAIRSGPDSTHPIVADRAVMEGEGVSPVAVDPNGGAIRLIPYENDPDYVVSGTPNINHTQNITIQNPQYAALALATVGEGHVLAMFDRQAMWNNGEGSDIEERDNKEILRRIVNYLAGADLENNPPTVDAGSGQTITLPDDTVNLDGTVTDPDGASPTTEWTKQSGPGSVTFGDSTQHDTTATFSVAGVYVLRLTASDGQRSAFDDVTINVMADQSNVVAAINSGGAAYTTDDGILYSTDTDFTGGNTYSNGDPISGTADDTLYQSERWGSFTYNVPVARGTYDVLLQFAEIYQTSNGTRIFDVSAEGEVVVNDLDIHANAGHDSAYDVLVSGIAVSDGSLTMTTSTEVENPKLSAFRIVFVSSIIDTDNDDIDDDWEIQYFGEVGLIDGSGDEDSDGVSDFFEYIYGSDPTDPAERGSPFVAQANEAGEATHFSWQVKEGFTLGTHYQALISTDLDEWNALPPEDYSLSSNNVDNKTSATLVLTQDYGDTVFLRLTKP